MQRKHETCQNESKIDFIYDEVKELRRDVKKLLQHRAYIMGGAGFLGFIISLVASILGSKFH